MPLAAPRGLQGAAAEGAPTAEHPESALLRPGPAGLLQEGGPGTPGCTLQRLKHTPLNVWLPPEAVGSNLTVF